ncbi:4-phosphopantetheinyl transferase family protein [Pedobacter polaris]|uniref:4-phosphopantetheinyl transferase family protein n=1 Tax=Pedobacter polaris TaxID=2571273 RepID=A0A4U1CHG1_9SPHI|nr:4'-phosphopantetheinyl transferase superfamily protein [Pedobacter polaris]TKC06711.1 4-phosphopantetheinyl transferase family protein [Pedobacter polaris]
MIGNDVVDLLQASIESNWKRKGYLAKIFTTEEQHIIQNSKDANATVWLLWSMKEAAYKIHNRKTKLRNFAPSKLICKIDYLRNGIMGSVSSGGEKYYTSSEINLNYIHTIAAQEQTQLAYISTSIYEIPYPSDYRLSKPACISHHGNYLALVYFANQGKC